MPGATGNGKRHEGDYYISGADLVVCVEKTLFRIHRYFFIRDSTFFEEKLPNSPSPGDVSEGSSDKNPLVLDDASKVDFERFLWIFYNPKYSLYDADADVWTSILKLAHQWKFREMKELAVRELQALSIAPLQRVVLYQKYDVNRDLLRPAFIALTTRDEPLEIDEGRELGLETALRLAKAREKARVPVFAGKKSGNPRLPVTLMGGELDTLIKDVFDLTTSTESSATPQTPAGQNTSGGSAQTSTPPADWTDSFIDNSSQGNNNGPANRHTNSTSNSHTQANGAPKSHLNGTTPTSPWGSTPKNMAELNNFFRK